MPDKDSSDKPTGLPTLSGEASWQKWWAVWKDHVFYEASLADPDKITHHAMLDLQFFVDAATRPDSSEAMKKCAADFKTLTFVHPPLAAPGALPSDPQPVFTVVRKAVVPGSSATAVAANATNEAWFKDKRDKYKKKKTEWMLRQAVRVALTGVTAGNRSDFFRVAIQVRETARKLGFHRQAQTNTRRWQVAANPEEMCKGKSDLVAAMVILSKQSDMWKKHCRSGSTEACSHLGWRTQGPNCSNRHVLRLVLGFAKSIVVGVLLVPEEQVSQRYLPPLFRTHV